MESPILCLVLLGLLAICEAVPAPGRPCRPVLCRMYCPYGWAKHPLTGCDMCKCAKPCRPVHCMMECPMGFKKDARGCKTCECAPPPVPTKKCKPVMCRMYCPFGFMRDANGCETCRCRRAPRKPRPTRCRFSKQCKKRCPYGYVTRFGCPICRCKRPRCTKKCPAGQVCHRQVIYCFRPPCPPPREVCQPKCGENEVFKTCTSPCTPRPTCENPKPNPKTGPCLAMCVPKCDCRAGFIWSKLAGKCIGRGQCPQQ